ncbi:Down syndrome cell adhesion molecule-like protein Dscam2 [Zerene cesonia]|uniref:Down syndrome cell adhesion molecule-like protein Dscam2 n=1 Tax=Zerene cesonia TaxID=33412 RepID=UPI0018E58014|nr:Down syndrome cell adhesion molecule-like protein Dscam2 [Zerene cesonia]
MDNSNGEESRISTETMHEKLDENWNLLNDKKRKRRFADNRVIITQHFTERTLTPGGDISMQCTAIGDRPPQFTWHRDGVLISSSTDTRYALGQIMRLDGSVLAQLNISRVRVEDGGLYSCTALEGDNVAVHENRFDVYGPPYIRALPPIKVQTGESLNLRCPYYGYPISKIDWEYTGKKITSSGLYPNRYKRTNIQKRSATNIHGTLSITEVTKQNNGAKYTCIVTSPSGEMARRDFEVKVIEAPILDDLLLGNNLQEGQVANIYCNVRTGDLPIHFEWLKDGKRIPSNLKVVERSSELFSALVIKSVALEHCGTYTCVATNHVATVNKSTELYIKVAPKWQIEPTNSSVVLGRSGLVSCSATGYPAPQVHWMKKDAILGTWQPVLELAGGGILSLANGTLVIDEVSLSDEGLYSCNIENGVGSPLSKTIWITVNKPAQVSAAARNATGRAGAALALACAARGDPPLRLAWARRAAAPHALHDLHAPHNLHALGHRFKISETKTEFGVTSTVNIHFAETRDAGVYQCTATNPYGSATQNVYLSVLEPPSPPTELRVETVLSRSATISWRASTALCSLQYTTAHGPVRWDAARTINVTCKEEQRQAFELLELAPGTPHAARLAALNAVAASAPSDPLYFTTLEEAPSSPPTQVLVSQTEAPGELFVTWAQPDTQTHNGHIAGYHVKAVPQNAGLDESKTRMVKVSPQTGKQGTTLSGLLKHTRYAVSVAAFNSAGSGPFSAPVTQETRAGAPESAPSSVECTAVAPSSLRVGWQPILGLTTEILGYSVLFATEDSPWQNQTSLHTELYLQNLMKYTNYTIKVAAYSSYGPGPFSYPIVCSTLEDVPGPPADIKVLVLSSSSLLISWKPPDQPNGEILYYTVYVKPIGLSGGVTLSQRVGGARTWAEARGLPAAPHEAWVAAHTRAGAGPPSKRLTQTPSHRVVAGVSSLGGPISVGAGSSLLLRCACVGSPAARTVWYHNHNIITHHPRFTRNHDDSLLINNIDQSLSGNYTCLAKNLYGSDSVEYTVTVLPLPDPPIIRATPYKESILIEWEQPHYSMNRTSNQKIKYSLTWKEANGPWQDSWSSDASPSLDLLGDASPSHPGVNKYLLTGLKCGTKYSIRIIASSKIGTSQPAYLETSTLGGAPVPPASPSSVWSNRSHIAVSAAGWRRAGCAPAPLALHYRPLGSARWLPAHELALESGGSGGSDGSGGSGGWVVAGGLAAGTRYELRVSAGGRAATYTYATKNEDGSEISPLSDMLDLNMLVIVLSSILLVVCLVSFVYILMKRHRTNNFTEYRDSITIDKSESGITSASQNNLAKENRIYSTPIPVRNNSKHELYEISPYAQFAVGFRTFGHVDNQDVPNAHRKHRYDSETSFQMCSESEDSDTISKNTLKSIHRSKCPKEVCRTPHYR